MESLIKTLEAKIAGVQPYVTLGDDYSIYLTDYQEGIIAGLRHAIKVIKESRE